MKVMEIKITYDFEAEENDGKFFPVIQLNNLYLIGGLVFDTEQEAKDAAKDAFNEYALLEGMRVELMRRLCPTAENFCEVTFDNAKDTE